MGWNRRNPSSATRKVWEAELYQTGIQKFRTGAKSAECWGEPGQGHIENSRVEDIWVDTWEVRAGKTHPSTSRELQGPWR